MSAAPRPNEERGSLAAFVAIIAIMFIGISVLVADGARRLGNMSRAEDLASEAARAAAATLDVGDLATGRAVIDRADGNGASAQVERLLESAGDDIEFRVVIADDRRSVRVDVIVNGTAVVPGFDIRGYGSHTAGVIEPAVLTSP